MMSVNFKNSMMARSALAAIGFTVMMLCAAPQASAQAAPTFTAAQAEQGKTAYTQNCERCHGKNLDDGEFGPPLSGKTFTGRWAGRPIADLFSFTKKTMPPDRPGGLGDQTYAQLIAYLLQGNGLPPAAMQLPADLSALTVMMMPGESSLEREMRAAGPGGGLSPGVALPPWPARVNPLDKMTPVTDSMLKNPSDDDWLIWRRTYDDLGFSPLTQITKEKVKNLHMAWSLALPTGPNEATPLVHDGVIFVHSNNDNVMALDAATGDKLWHYARQLPDGVRGSTQRNISLYGDKVYFGTSDANLVALDAKTGKLMWEQQIGDPKTTRITGGPLLAKGKVMVGTVGRAPGGQYIVGLDAETGKPAWRFNTIAQPGEPNDSWNGLPLALRNGGSVWTAGSYDPEQNLAFFGPAPTYDTGPMRDRVNKRGVRNDALYTNATVALNPDTGKLAWFFQHVPNDQWDFDWAFERQIVHLPVNGQTRKLIITAGKEALYDAIDAQTGKYVFSIDMGLQSLISAVDPKTGAKTIDPALIPGTGKKTTVCPHAGGAKNWTPASYSPSTKILYVPLVESCMDMIPVAPGERGSLTTGVRWALRPPLNSDGKYGRLTAVNLETHKTLWVERQRAPQTTGVLATAGGVVFAGSLDRWFKAYDDASGKVLWQVQLSDVPNSTPISYRVNGKQYVAMVVGNGGPITATYPPLIPEIAAPVARSSSIFVFELPE